MIKYLFDKIFIVLGCFFYVFAAMSMFIGYYILCIIGFGLECFDWIKNKCK